MDEQQRFIKEYIELCFPDDSVFPESVRSKLRKDWRRNAAIILAKGFSAWPQKPSASGEKALEWLREHSGLVTEFSQGFMTKIVSETMREFVLNMGFSRSTFELAMEHLLVADDSPDGFFIKDLSNKYAVVNAALAEMLGKPQSEIIGHSDRDIYPPDHAELLEKAFDAAMAGDLVRHERIWWVKGNKGKKIKLLEMFWAKLSPEGPVGIYGVVRKISAAKRSEPLEPVEDDRYPSQAMKETLKTCLLAATHNSVVLLTGETGSGKDWLAQYIHQHSRRPANAYFSINCATITKEMAESELFGHEKGAFTGADNLKQGQLELAEEGTLFLNEIGELPLMLQSKLLTFLDTHDFARVGGVQKVTVNARLIAATNRNLAQDKESGRFREDLFHRLHVFPIKVPSLRERMEDMPILVYELLTKLAREMELASLPVIDAGAMEKLRRYSWPGNVRELRNVLERAIIISPDGTITADTIHFDSKTEAAPQSETPIEAALRPLSHLSDEELKQMYQEVCVRFVEEKGERLGEKGSARAIATIFDCARETVSRKLKELDCPEIEKGSCSTKKMDNLIRRLETWLTRHDFDLERTPR